jgi:hypothetical protein
MPDHEEVSYHGYFDNAEPTQRHRLYDAGIDPDCTPVDTFINGNLAFSLMEDEG